MTPTNTDDLIGSLDVISRIEDLDGSTDAEDIAELDALRALAEEAAQYAPDWEHGETLIRDTYFKTYAQDLAEDCGMIDDSAKWPNSCIDWDHAARELQYDYTAVDFGGVTYWTR